MSRYAIMGIIYNATELAKNLIVTATGIRNALTPQANRICCNISGLTSSPANHTRPQPQANDPTCKHTASDPTPQCSSSLRTIFRTFDAE